MQVARRIIRKDRGFFIIQGLDSKSSKCCGNRGQGDRGTGGQSQRGSRKFESLLEHLNFEKIGGSKRDLNWRRGAGARGREVAPRAA